MASLDPQWAGVRSRRITTDEEVFIVETANQRPPRHWAAFTRWSIHKLVEYLANSEQRVVDIGRKRLRQMLADHDITFQRTKTWKGSNHSDLTLSWTVSMRSSTPTRTGVSRSMSSDRCRFARPVVQRGFRRGISIVSRRTTTSCTGSSSSTAATRSVMMNCGVWSRHRKSAANTLQALKSIRAQRRDRGAIYAILDNYVSTQGHNDPHPGSKQQHGVVFNTDLQLLGEPDWRPLRATTRIRVEQPPTTPTTLG